MDIAQHDNVIFDVSEQDFGDKVINASMERPVIVDFWAPWCGPCKQLGPVLEQEVMAQKGQVLMAKVNVDDNQMLAGQLRIQSIPMVYGFFQGRPIDGFQGVISESDIKKFIQNLIAAAGGENQDPDIDGYIETIKELLEQGDDTETAMLMAQELNQNYPDNDDIVLLLLQALIANDQRNDALNFIENNATDEQKKRPEIVQILASSQMIARASHLDVQRLEQLITQDTHDYSAKHDYALAVAAKGQFEQAMDILLDIIKDDKEWENGKARTTLLELFEALGQTDPLTLKKRRALSSLLFA